MTSLVLAVIAAGISGRPCFSVGIDTTRTALSHRLGCWLDLERINIAPSPVFSGLEAPDDRMLCLMVVLRRVLVGRVVAATNMAAGETEAKVDPLTAHFETFFTSIRRTGTHIANISQMRAVAGHHTPR